MIPNTLWDAHSFKKRKWLPRKRDRGPVETTTDIISRYLTADYERRIFKVSQCTWVAGADENVVTITSKDTAVGGDSIASFSGGVIAGIVVGTVESEEVGTPHNH
jgi:hypothetical protein